MPNATTVTLVNGVPTAPSGTVSTIDNIPALWDKGAGTAGALTQRVIMDSSQLASLSTSAQAIAAGAQLVTLPTDVGVPIYAAPANLVSGAITTAMTATTSTSLIAAPGSGLRNYITQITVSNSHATVGTDVAIQDDVGGATIYTIPAAAVYGGAVVTFPAPLRQPTANKPLACVNVTTGASTKVSASGFKAA